MTVTSDGPMHLLTRGRPLQEGAGRALRNDGNRIFEIGRCYGDGRCTLIIQIPYGSAHLRAVIGEQRAGEIPSAVLVVVALVMFVCMGRFICSKGSFYQDWLPWQAFWSRDEMQRQVAVLHFIGAMPGSKHSIQGGHGVRPCTHVDQRCSGSHTSGGDTETPVPGHDTDASFSVRRGDIRWWAALPQGCDGCGGR